MRAIAFAIICAAYLLITKHEWNKSSELDKAINSGIFVISILGFWICIILNK